jgi:hypothetical protein
MRTKSKAALSLAAGVALACAVVALFQYPAERVSSQQRRNVRQTVAEPVQEEEYVATRKIIFDRETSALRVPNAEELDALVADLKRLTDRSTDGLRRFPLKGGGEGMDLDGKFGGVMLARAKADGTSEIRCVFSFEEGASFLGLEEKTDDR